MVVVPGPAIDGVNTPDATPVPEYVPPAGLPFDKLIGAAFAQTGLSAEAVTTGVVVTTMFVLAEERHPFALVYE